MKENFAGLSKFLQMYRNFDCLRSNFIKEWEKKLSKTGFKMVSSTWTNDGTNFIFRRNAISALSQQISETNYTNIMSHKISGDLHSHPLNSDIRRDTCRWIEQEIKGYRDAEVHWSTVAENGVQSLVGCLQMYSDMSQTSLVAGEVVLYSLHWTILNVLEQTRQHHISNESTIIEYTPASYKRFSLMCSTERFEKHRSLKGSKSFYKPFMKLLSTAWRALGNTRYEAFVFRQKTKLKFGYMWL